MATPLPLECSPGDLLLRMTSLDEKLGRSILPHEVSEAVKQGFADALGMEFVEDNLTPDEIRLAKELHDGKYTQDEWNRMR